MEELIICSMCGHSVEKHFEDYDGCGCCNECMELYPDPDYLTDNVLKWCRERPEHIELEYYKKQTDVKTLANKELQRRIIELVNDLRAIINAKEEYSARDLRDYAWDCLLKKGYISNNNEPV